MSESLREEAYPEVLPRGRNAISRDVVRISQRTRLLAAMTLLAAEKGYPKVTIADLVAEAGVAKPTFYDHFSDKENCFMAVLDTIVEQAGAAIAAELLQNASVEDRVDTGVRALIGFLASDDARARVLLIESLKGGPTVAAALTEAHKRMAALYVQWREESRAHQTDLPPISINRGLAIVGANLEPMTVLLREYPAKRLVELTDELIIVTKALALA